MNRTPYGNIAVGCDGALARHRANEEFLAAKLHVALKLIRRVAFPARGSGDDWRSLADFAAEFADAFPLYDLNQLIEATEPYARGEAIAAHSPKPTTRTSLTTG